MGHNDPATGKPENDGICCVDILCQFVGKM